MTSLFKYCFSESTDPRTHFMMKLIEYKQLSGSSAFWLLMKLDAGYSNHQMDEFKKEYTDDWIQSQEKATLIKNNKMVASKD